LAAGRACSSRRRRRSSSFSRRCRRSCWIGSALATERGIDLACVGRRLDVPQTHDDLYRPALGLFDVTTPTYDRALDTFVGCRGRSP
jgi:hypothetical protein